jgi:hypothetical protein
MSAGSSPAGFATPLRRARPRAAAIPATSSRRYERGSKEESRDPIRVPRGLNAREGQAEKKAVSVSCTKDILPSLASGIESAYYGFVKFSRDTINAGIPENAVGLSLSNIFLIR